LKKFWALILTLVLCMSFTTTSLADYDLEEKLLDAGWSGEKSSITIVVEQPISGTRNAVSEYPDTNVGHTFIRLEKKTATGAGSYVSYFGFYPKDGVEKKDVAFSKNVPGKVYWVTSEFDHGWNIARTYAITPEKADEVMNWARNYSTNYNIETNNCTTFAYNALIKAGISSSNTGISKHSWTLPQSWKDEIPVFRSWYGYTPGDAGEDLRGRTNVFTN
jgi:hypothetical protein